MARKEPRGSLRIVLRTRDSPLCVAPTLKPFRHTLYVEPAISIFQLKKRIQALCKQPGGIAQLVPDKQFLYLRLEESGGTRSVRLNDDDTLLSYDCESGTEILLVCTPPVPQSLACLTLLSSGCHRSVSNHWVCPLSELETNNPPHTHTRSESLRTHHSLSSTLTTRDRRGRCRGRTTLLSTTH